MRFLTLIPFLFISLCCNAQIGISTNSPDSSAALEIKDTARGILIPRMTLNQRTAIANPAEGLMVYQNDGVKGFWYFDGTQWLRNGTSPGNTGSGKSIIILTDTITNIQAQIKIAAELGANTQEIRIIGCTNLTTIDLSAVTQIVSLHVIDNPLLQSVDLRNLINCDGDFELNNCPLLTNLNLNSLQRVVGLFEDFEFLNLGLSELNLPSLRLITNSLQIQGNESLQSVLIPLLEKAGGVRFSSNMLLSSITLSALIKTGNIYIGNNNNLNLVSFPLLAEFSGIQGPLTINNNLNLNSIQIPSLAVFNSGYFNVTGNKLTTSNINNLLNILVSITPNISGVNIDLSHQTPLAPPSDEGITHKNTLIANGNTVTTD